MEYIANKLTSYLFKNGTIEKEEFEVYQYGFETFLEIGVSIFCSIIIAFLLDMKLECILFFLFFIPLRSFSGGLHMKSYLSCLFLSIFTLTSVLLIVKYIYLASPVSFVIFLVSLISLKLIGPVDHPNREVDQDENKLFVRRTNITFLISIITAIIFLLLQIEKLLFLLSLIYLLVFITSLIGKLLYKRKS